VLKALTASLGSQDSKLASVIAPNIDTKVASVIAPIVDNKVASHGAPTLLVEEKDETIDPPLYNWSPSLKEEVGLSNLEDPMSTHLLQGVPDLDVPELRPRHEVPKPWWKLLDQDTKVLLTLIFTCSRSSISICFSHKN
jgi:hypothetical protein